MAAGETTTKEKEAFAVFPSSSTASKSMLPSPKELDVETVKVTSALVVPEAISKSFRLIVLDATSPLVFKVLKPASAVMEMTIEKESAALTFPPSTKVVPSEVVADREMSMFGTTTSIGSTSSSLHP